MIVLFCSSFQASFDIRLECRAKGGVIVEREENSESIPIVRLVSPIAVAAAAVLQLLDPLRHFCGIWPATTILLQFNAMLPPPPGRLSWLSKMVQEIRESNAAQLTTSTVGSLLYFDGWRVEPPSSSSSPYKLSYWDLQADRQDAHSGKKDNFQLPIFKIWTTCFLNVRYVSCQGTSLRLFSIQRAKINFCPCVPPTDYTQQSGVVANVQLFRITSKKSLRRSGVWRRRERLPLQLRNIGHFLIREQPSTQVRMKLAIFPLLSSFLCLFATRFCCCHHCQNCYCWPRRGLKTSKSTKRT